MNRDLELRKQAYEAVEENAAIVAADPYRQSFHLMPPVGLLNDPNGVVKWKDTYHVFYQWMPFKTDHGAKFWGHYTSKDLVHWKHEEIALTPSEWFEKNGCYSGSAIEHQDELRLYYTGNVKDENNERASYQCLATSKDGIEFVKRGVVVELPDGYTPHFRDPKVWKEGADWYMVVGAQTEDERGAVAFFHSHDGVEWTHRGMIAGSEIGGLSDFGYMWECPDLFTLGDQDILVASPQGLEADGMLYQNVYQAGYFLGSLDRESAVYTHGAFTELDRGFDFYAPQTLEDENGRRMMIGWMSVPDQNEQDHPTIAHKWIHNLTIPRVLTFENGSLKQRPAEELTELRQTERVNETISLTDGQDSRPEFAGKVMEFRMDNINVEDGKTLELLIQDHVRASYNVEEGVFTLARKSYVDGEWEVRQCELAQLTSLQLFLDHSSIELFLNDGDEVFSARFFPKATNDSFAIRSVGTVKAHLTKWDFK